MLDDTDRIFTQTWISVGGAKQANRDRVQMKLRLNHPLQLFFGAAAASEAQGDDNARHPSDGADDRRHQVEEASASALRQRRRQQSTKPSLLSSSPVAALDLAKVSALPPNLHLQSVRSVSASAVGVGTAGHAGGGGVLVRIRHMYAVGEDEVLSAPSDVDVLALFGSHAKQAVEVTLTGILPKAQLKRHRFPVDGEVGEVGVGKEEEEDEEEEEEEGHDDGFVSVKAFELRTFLVT